MRFESYTKLVKYAVKSAILKVSPGLYFGAQRTLLPTEPELSLVEKLAEPTRDAVDIGAHFGMWTHAFERNFHHVYAFEPIPRLADVLRGPRRKNVTVHEVALSRERGEVTLRMPVAGLGRSTIEGKNPLANLWDPTGPVTAVTVATTRLDDYGLADVGFIKIDVEGHELDVLDGGQATIARALPVLVIEMVDEHNPGAPKVIIERLRTLGYRPFRMTATSLNVVFLQPAHEARLAGSVHLEPVP